MITNLAILDNVHRLLFNVPLQPIQGTRFQPTGFPDLGAATYQAGDTDCLLVESAQSMANRLEQQVWDEASQQLVAACQGLSYVRVNQDNNYLTSSLTESHRINSPYILEGKDRSFADQIAKDFDVLATGPIKRKVLAEILFKYDANALIHGVFLAKKELAGGRLRVTRALSAFIEAKQVAVAASGGVKNDHVDPSGDTSKGFGNVPFHREEFTAREIMAYFNLDLDQIRGYGLPKPATELLILLSLFKIRSLLDGALRLRTACDLAVIPNYDFKAIAPVAFTLYSKAELEVAIQTKISECAKANLFGSANGITTVNYSAEAKKAKKSE
jgi:CRISPR-associated protein Csb1